MSSVRALFRGHSLHDNWNPLGLRHRVTVGLNIRRMLSVELFSRCLSGPVRCSAVRHPTAASNDKTAMTTENSRSIGISNGLWNLAANAHSFDQIWKAIRAA